MTLYCENQQRFKDTNVLCDGHSTIEQQGIIQNCARNTSRGPPPDDSEVGHRNAPTKSKSLAADQPDCNIVKRAPTKKKKPAIAEQSKIPSSKTVLRPRPVETEDFKSSPKREPQPENMFATQRVEDRSTTARGRKYSTDYDRRVQPQKPNIQAREKYGGVYQNARLKARQGHSDLNSQSMLMSSMPGYDECYSAPGINRNTQDMQLLYQPFQPQYFPAVSYSEPATLARPNPPMQVFQEPTTYPQLGFPSTAYSTAPTNYSMTANSTMRSTPAMSNTLVPNVCAYKKCKNNHKAPVIPDFAGCCSADCHMKVG
ncbi:hypothetical protein HYALB_00012904 [Hymenoscyphus albidus]|uniref:Uncharacterized protein n=1 Tax=Hymenoscyphus albidus TaxID=595503 RepID=A0A9N9LXF0_9HELO|nr:hypothetical protein HYALB_00012904 [Hymenoscyphus albidus]